MGDDVDVRLTASNHMVLVKRTHSSEAYFNAGSQRVVVALSDDVLKLTRVVLLNLNFNLFPSVPRAVLQLTTLRRLFMQNNQLESLPRELAMLRLLDQASFDNNQISSPLPAELCELRLLKFLWLRGNRLDWLPIELDRLPASTRIHLSDNRLPVAFERDDDARSRLDEVFAATTVVSMIRASAATVAIALQDLELPALVTLEIIDAAFANSVRMAAKWDLVVAVKHWHDRP